jgi:two-component system, NarL family, response regulator NreC
VNQHHPSNQIIRVLLAEDHTIVREGLRALLAGTQDIQVVGEASDGREALELALRLRPDVVIMDVTMPGLNGVDATLQLRRQLPNCSVLMLSMHASEDYVRSAIRAGAKGYLVKGSGIADLVTATKAVAKGEAFFCPAAAATLLREARQATQFKEDSTVPEELSIREREVLQLVAEGQSSREIAAVLHISVKTVDGHRGKIMEKLDIHELAGLVRYAMRKGIISPES